MACAEAGSKPALAGVLCLLAITSQRVAEIVSQSSERRLLWNSSRALFADTIVSNRSTRFCI